jgi:hypothetical protein
MAKLNYDGFRAVKAALMAEQSALADYALTALQALSIWPNRVGVPKNWNDTIELPEDLAAAVLPSVIAASEREGTRESATAARKELCGA